MPIQVFPVASTSSSGVTSSAITVTSSYLLHQATLALNPGIYTISCASATITYFELLSDATTVVYSGQTVSGTLSFNLATATDRIRLYINTGTNVVVTIALTANALTNTFSGTLDTISTTSQYTGTSASGLGYAMVSGGGGGGGFGNHADFSAGAGGGGGTASKLISLTGAMSVVLGAGGNGSAGSGSGFAGGQSTFGGMTANGGNGGSQNSFGGAGGGGSGGTASGGAINNTGNSGGSSHSVGSPGAVGYPFAIGGMAGGNGGNGGFRGNGNAGNIGIAYVLRF
jgi:hypothetical protein